MAILPSPIGGLYDRPDDVCPKCGKSGHITERYARRSEELECPGRICWDCQHTWFIKKESTDKPTEGEE